MTTYLFCIGGTGARVLRSLTMLLASGVKLPKGDNIVPIILDYDLKNADLEQAKMLLGMYEKLHNVAKYEADEEGFFRASIDIRPYSIVDIKNDSGKETFKKFLDYPTLKAVAPASALLVEALYDDSIQDNPCTELNLEMSKGFKGNPNIGSVVFNDYFKNSSYGYDQFVANFGPDDRVFMVGSIFGGTGSSGLPSLVKKFRREASSMNLQNAAMGACVVLPYFDVASKDTSAINSLTFNSKAKAALTYYKSEINNKLNEIYYLGCSKKKEAYDNFEGGAEQKNNAHLIEILAAMSVVEFAGRDSRDLFNKDDNGAFIPTCYEYHTTTGIVEKDGKPQLVDPSFEDVLAKPNTDNVGVYFDYVKHLNEFAYFTKYCQDYTYAGKDNGWFAQAYADKKTGLGSYIDKSTEFGGLLSDFQNAFITWAKELETNPLLQFSPFDFEHNLEMMLHVTDSTSKIKGLEDEIRRVLNQSFKDLGGKEYNNKEGQFIRIGKAAGEAAANLVK